MTDTAPASDTVLGDRALGWLRFLHRKATTPDDWSAAGHPAPWWDDRSTPPVLNFARFDLSESSYAVPMMADVTPAWREVYVEIMDGLLARHTTHWAAIDWLTQIGHDPDRANYPEEMVRLWLPQHLAGEYDMPGWTANGVEPWGLAPDPVGAEGNLFLQGLVQPVARLPRLRVGRPPVERAVRRDGAGGGELLLDPRRHQRAAHPAVDRAPGGPALREHQDLAVLPERGPASGCACTTSSPAALTTGSTTSGWRSPGTASWASRRRAGRVDGALPRPPRRLHPPGRPPPPGSRWPSTCCPRSRCWPRSSTGRRSTRSAGVTPARPVRSLPDPRFLLLGVVLAREFGDEITLARLTRYASDHFEPGFPGAGLQGSDEFGWGFGLDEPYPRGQLNGLLMMAEIGAPGAWSRVFTQPNLAKFGEPTVCGVDFPRLGIREARNAGGVLHIGSYAGTAAERGGAHVAAGHPAARRGVLRAAPRRRALPALARARPAHRPDRPGHRHTPAPAHVVQHRTRAPRSGSQPRHGRQRRNAYRTRRGRQHRSGHRPQSRCANSLGHRANPLGPPAHRRRPPSSLRLLLTPPAARHPRPLSASRGFRQGESGISSEGRAVQRPQIGPRLDLSRRLETGVVPTSRKVDLSPVSLRRRPVTRLAQLLVGLVLYGTSMAAQVRSGLGLNPWDVLHQGLAPRFGLELRRGHRTDRGPRAAGLDPAAAAPRGGHRGQRGGDRVRGRRGAGPDPDGDRAAPGGSG